MQICGETLHRRLQQHSEINLLEADTAKENLKRLSARSALTQKTDTRRSLRRVRKVPNPEVGLLDHLVGADHKGIRDCDPDYPRGLEVHGKPELCGLLHRKIARPLTV